MGFAIARAAREAGAAVTLVAGPVSLATLRGVLRLDVGSTSNWLSAVMEHAKAALDFIATAALADWRPEQAADQKMKKEGTGLLLTLRFVENADILATLAQSPQASRGDLFCVGVAAESHDLLAHAQAKRLRKGVPMLVGNVGPATFGQDDNALLLVEATGTQEFARDNKLALASKTIAVIADRVRAGGQNC